jgi:CO/xanthine dehydrogenase Mo-binding subunit
MIGPDGKVKVLTGEVDLGQGYKTVAAQCAAEELGVSVDHVEIVPVDSQTSILGIGCLASRGTVMGGNAVKMAAGDARQKILAAAGELLGRNPGSLRFRGGVLQDTTSKETLGTFPEIIGRLATARAGQPWIGAGCYVPDTVLPDPATQYGNPSPCYSYAAHVAEVAIDTETGRVELVNYVAVNDAGTIINPLLARGQMEGAVVQGMGWAFNERVIVRDGEILNKNLLDYTVPTFADMPPITSLFVETNDRNGPYGAKSLGEPSFNPVATAIANAVFNAVGVRITELPITAEKLLAALKLRWSGGKPDASGIQVPPGRSCR